MQFTHLTKPKQWNPSMEVVSCILWHNDAFLCLLRNPDKSEGGKWGLPSGKIEDDEQIETALSREIREELSIALPEMKFLKKFYVRYPNIDFEFNVYEGSYETRPKIEIQLSENSQFEWMTIEEFLAENVVNGNVEVMSSLYL